MNVEKKILEGILSVIEKISNIQYQQKAWIERKILYATFEETMHQLFDDYELNDVLHNYEVYRISNSQYKILNHFKAVVDRYSDEKMSWLGSVNPKEILEDSKWHEIQNMAKEVLEAFRYSGGKEVN